jgi:hypothetical protein
MHAGLILIFYVLVFTLTLRMMDTVQKQQLYHSIINDVSVQVFTKLISRFQLLLLPTLQGVEVLLSGVPTMLKSIFLF